MVAYAALGDRAKALATYERCAQALQELGLEPSEEIRALAEVKRPAADRPSGTVTFLFTDIEGSTMIAQEHRETWEALRVRHHALLQSAMELHGGHVFQIVGDAFCVAFHTAGEALDCRPRSAAQIADGTMGGDADQSAHGDQHGCSPGRKQRRWIGWVYRLFDIGAHATRDVHRLRGADPALQRQRGPVARRTSGGREPARYEGTSPERSRQPRASLAGGGTGSCTRLSGSANAQQHSKQPANPTDQFHWPRERDCRDQESGGTQSPGDASRVRAALARPGMLFRSAAELLDAFADGVWLVELAPVSDAALVPQALATVLGVREDQGHPLMTALQDHLESKTILVVLDNCEHLLEACAQLADSLLHTCPRLKILVSSREALGMAGEVSFRVPSLSLPDAHHLPSLESLTQYDSVRLFIERAVAVKSDFVATNENAPAVAQVCSRLDGIPLAIELAAARVKGLSVEQISERLDDRFRLLTGGSRTALPRHQTLRAMIEWSYDLLSEAERVLLRRLAVFVGDWTLEAAEAVCAAA